MPFLTNKANFGKAQMNVNIYYIKIYQNFIPLAGQKNKPNSNPIKPNLKKAKMNVKSVAYIYLRSIMSLLGRS
jgi:hypothetical protein